MAARAKAACAWVLGLTAGLGTSAAISCRTSRIEAARSSSNAPAARSTFTTTSPPKLRCKYVKYQPLVVARRCELLSLSRFPARDMYSLDCWKSKYNRLMSSATCHCMRTTPVESGPASSSKGWRRASSAAMAAWRVSSTVAQPCCTDEYELGYATLH
jgi:hypothetical protein